MMKNRTYHVYKHFDASGALLYVGVSIDATGNRLREHRSKSAWFESIARIETQDFPTREAAIAAEAEAIRNEQPKFNRAPGAVVVAKRRERDRELQENDMARKLAPLHPGEVLREEFMKPLGLTGHRVALACYVPRGCVQTRFVIVDQGFNPAQIAAGVTNEGKAKYRGLHTLRHFYASWCINRRIDGGLELPLKLVQARLGHASIQMTADTYGHLFPRVDDGSELAAAERAFLAG